MHARNVHLALQHAQEYPDHLLTSLSRLFAGLYVIHRNWAGYAIAFMGRSSRNEWAIFCRFVEHYLPDLHAEERVAHTCRCLTAFASSHIVK